LWGNLRERDPLVDLGVNARIALKWIFKKRFGDAWTDLMWVRIGTDGGHL